jgi:hypothetical protein
MQQKGIETLFLSHASVSFVYKYTYITLTVAPPLSHLKKYRQIIVAETSDKSLPSFSMI